MKVGIKKIFINLCVLCGIVIFLYGIYSYVNMYVLDKDSSTQSPISDSDIEILSKVYKLCEEKNFEEAETILRDLVKSSNSNVYFLHELGVVLGLERKFDDAIACFDSIIKESPNMILAYFNRAQAKLLSGRFDDARREYVGIKLLFPQAKKQADRGIEILEKVSTEGKKQIKDQLEQRVSINKKDAQALFSLGKLALREKEFDKAKEYFSKALEYEPEVEGYQVALSNTLVAKGEIEQAEKILKEAKEKKPDNKLVRVSLGFYYLKTRQLKAAETEFQEIQEAFPQQIDALIGLGLIEFTRNNIEKARDYFQKIVEDKSSHHYSRNLLGTCHLMLGDYDQAIIAFSYIIEHDQTAFSAYRNLGDAYLRKTNYQKAVQYYKKYLELVPDDPDKKALQQFIDSYYM